MANEPGKVNPRDVARQVNARNAAERKGRMTTGPHGPSAAKVLRPLILAALEKGPATCREIARRIGAGSPDQIHTLCKTLERRKLIARVAEAQRIASPFAHKRNTVSLAPIMWALVIRGVQS